MVEIKIEIECDYEVDQLFEQIRTIQQQLKNERGIDWHTLSYFYNESSPYWRFDWQYLWNKDHQDLKSLLLQAIEAGNELLQ